MAGIYTIKARSTFSAAHALRGYQGDCARIHGHNWTIEVEVVSKSLDKLGIALDFRELKQKLQEIVNVVEHQYLNEIAPFDEINPTAENIAAWFYQQLQKIINNDNSELTAVTIWETDKFSIRYTQNN